MLKGLNILFVSLLIINNIGYSQNFEWATSIGGSGDDFGHAITQDLNGNIYVTGAFEGTVDFNPGAGVFNLTSNGGKDIFIQKLDSNGNFIWAISMGAAGTGYELGKSIVTDSLGNVYTTGYFQGAVDFDPDTGVSTLNSNNRGLFVQKLDSNGNFIWANAALSNNYIGGESICIDNVGNLYVTGTFKGSAYFNFGGNINLSSYSNASSPYFQYTDFFILKFDDSGNALWIKNMGGTYSTIVPNSIITDSSTNVYVTGWHRGVADFDHGIGISNMNGLGTRAAFIAKYDSSSNYIWSKTFNGNNNTMANDICIDNQNNIILTGEFEGTVDFNSDTLVNNLTSNGLSDVYVQKLDSNGNFIWAKSMGGNVNDVGNSITTDKFDNVYIVGVFGGSNVDFDTGLGIDYRTSKGDYDIFLQKLSSTGNYLWAVDIGNSAQDYCQSVVMNKNSNTFYAAGRFSSTVDFNPGLGIANLISNGGQNDQFVLKLSQDSCSNFSLAIDSLSNISCIDSGYVFVSANGGGGSYTYSWNTSPIVNDSSIAVDRPGLYSCTYGDANGCIEISSVKVNMNYLNESQNIIICQGDSIFLEGKYQKVTGIYKDTLTTSLLCDSIITTNLTVNNSFSNIYITQCDSFNSPMGNTYYNSGVYYDTLPGPFGCDSIIKINLNIKGYTSSVILNEIACDSFVSYSGNYTWYNTGTYFDTTASSTGCDIYMTVNLTIDNFMFNNSPINICQGDSMLIYGDYQSVAGTYYDSLQTINGCDSILSTTLTVNPLPNVTITSFNPDTICSNGSVVTLPNGSPSGGVYSGTGVSGGTFDPNMSGVGIHSVIYTYTDINSCINSDSTFITVEQCVGIDDFVNDLGILIYPNPNTGLFTIEKSSELDKEVNISLLDASSRVIIDKVIPKGQQKIEMDITSYSKGVYYLQMTIGGKVYVKQILKN